MHRALLSLLSVLVVLAVSVVAAGCGKDDLNPEAVAQAAEKTRKEESSRISFAVKATGMGLPQELTLRGSGVAALNAADMDLTMDLGPALALAGAQADGETRIVVVDGSLYVKVPAVQGFELPGGKSWVGLDLRRAVDAMGADGEALGALAAVTPEATLTAITSADGIKEAGEEEIDGAPTTHYTGEVALKDFLEALPEDRRESAQKALEQAMKESGQKDEPQPIDVWVDEEGRIRRLGMRTEMPAQSGVPKGTMAMTFDYTDFGAEVTAAAPPKGETLDATEMIADALKQQAAAQPQS